jgi:DNA topoisomerase IB
VDDPDVLQRIRALAIPPAWEDVWICPWANGHLQATGTDSAGRRQYLYHTRWRSKRDAEKYRRIQEFGHALPQLRETVARDMRRHGLGKRRVLATAVRLLDIGLFRIGGEQYAEESETYGVATLLKSHVQRRGDSLIFDYDAKGGKRRVAVMSDSSVVAVIAGLKRRRTGGDALLAWKGSDGWVPIRSVDINDYIKAAAGAQFSAKDFRTWSATVLAAAGFATESVPNGRPSRAQVNRVIRQVAQAIGDTPAVCRRSYVDPVVVDRFRRGDALPAVLARAAADPDEIDWTGRLDEPTRQRVEKAVLRVLDGG